MAAVCFYFQVHQPFRLRRYSVFDTDPFYFDNATGPPRACCWTWSGGTTGASA
jgi:hypothetical protein